MNGDNQSQRFAIVAACVAFGLATVVAVLAVPTIRGRLAAAARPGGPVQSANGLLVVDLPPGWAAAPITGATGQVQAKDVAKAAYAEVGMAAKADLVDPDLKAWAERSRAVSGNRTKLRNRVPEPLQSVTLGGQTAYRFRLTGETTPSGFKVVYYHTYVQTGRQLVDVICWTTPTHEAESVADFDHLAGHVTDAKYQVGAGSPHCCPSYLLTQS